MAPAASPNFTYQALSTPTFAMTLRGTVIGIPYLTNKETKAQAGEVMELEKWPNSEPNTEDRCGSCCRRGN